MFGKTDSFDCAFYNQWYYCSSPGYITFGMEEKEPVERAMLKVNITVLKEVDTAAAVTIIPVNSN